MKHGEWSKARRARREVGRDGERGKKAEDRGKIADCGFEIDEVSVFRFQILCLFFLTPET